VREGQYKFVVIDGKTGAPSSRLFTETQVLHLLKKLMPDPQAAVVSVSMKKIFKVALQTLAELMCVLGQQAAFPMLLANYREMTMENTVKLLVRCRQAILTRRLAYQTLKLLMRFEKLYERIKADVELSLQESQDGAVEGYETDTYLRIKKRAEDQVYETSMKII